MRLVHPTKPGTLNVPEDVYRRMWADRGWVPSDTTPAARVLRPAVSVRPSTKPVWYRRLSWRAAEHVAVAALVAKAVAPLLLALL